MDVPFLVFLRCSGKVPLYRGGLRTVCGTLSGTWVLGLWRESGVLQAFRLKVKVRLRRRVTWTEELAIDVAICNIWSWRVHLTTFFTHDALLTSVFPWPCFEFLLESLATHCMATRRAVFERVFLSK